MCSTGQKDRRSPEAQPHPTAEPARSLLEFHPSPAPRSDHAPPPARPAPPAPPLLPLRWLRPASDPPRSALLPSTPPPCQAPSSPRPVTDLKYWPPVGSLPPPGFAPLPPSSAAGPVDAAPPAASSHHLRAPSPGT